MKVTKAYIGLDVHKETIAVAIAEEGPTREVIFYGNISNRPSDLHRIVRKLRDKYEELEFTYEAGPCGYTIYRELLKMGELCTVVAPSHIFNTTGVRIKNDRRDAILLARLARAQELTPIWVPDEIHEAMRDLVRARHATTSDLRKAKQRIQSFLLRYKLTYPKKAWTVRHRYWLANLTFAHEAQQITIQHYIHAMEQSLARREQIEQEIKILLPTWSLSPFVYALQALRGIAFVIAVSIVAEIGDIRRFNNPKQLMAYLGLIPGEHSSGAKIRPRGITKVGNSQVRALLFEAAWCYRQKPKVGAYMLQHMPAGIPQTIKDIAWKAQLRLTKKYRYLMARGKRSSIAITAVARELLGFIWAISFAVELSAT